MWPDTQVSFILVYYISSCCGYFAHPALCALTQEPHERFGKLRPSWGTGNGGGLNILLRKLFALEDFCERRKNILLIFSCSSLVLTALVCRWTWWWFHGSTLSLVEALASILSVEFAGCIFGLGLHQWILSAVLFPRKSVNSMSQMEGGDSNRLRIVPPGESPPASPTGRRVV